MIRLAGFLLIVGLAPLRADTPLVRDCAECPQVRLLPGGTFMMGALADEAAALHVPARLAALEQPRHRVSVRPFAIGIHEVTVGEYAAFAEATGRPAIGNCFSRDATGARAAIMM